MLVPILLLALGITGLYFGADWLVRGASRVALAFGVEPLFIGLTIVAFGTSAPEVVVSIVASLRGNSAVVLGNVLGSNVANVGLILGLSAAITPVRVSLRLARRELPFLLGITLIFYLMAWRLFFGRLEGVLFLLTLVFFSWLALRWGRQEPAAVVQEMESYEKQEGLLKRFHAVRDIGLVAVGLGALAAGGHFLVAGATELARLAGLSEFTIAATVVAVGSSLPELATSIVAALRKEADILVGNLVGSNLFNILGALGVAAVVRPVRLEPALLGYEFIALLVFTAALAVLFRGRQQVTRVQGILLLVAYGAFVAGLFRH